MQPQVDVKFDGRVFVARKRGAQGLVFGATQEEATGRAGTWDWRHFPKLPDTPHKPKPKHRGGL